MPLDQPLYSKAELLGIDTTFLRDAAHFRRAPNEIIIGKLS
jgi:hypothetical protein